MTLGSLSVSIRPLHVKLQALYAFRFVLGIA